MSIDFFVVTPHLADELRPRLIGLGDAPFVWPDADDARAFEYDNAQLSFSAQALRPDGEEDSVASRLCRIAPAMKTLLTLWLRDYRTDFEWALAIAFDGSSTSDAVLFSELWDEAIGGSGVESVLSPLPANETARSNARREVRAAFWGDRYAMSSKEGAAMIEAAVGGSEDALAVLHFWNGEGAKGKRRFDIEVLRALVSAALQSVRRAPADVLPLFERPNADELDDATTLQLLARVIEPGAFQKWKARAESARAATEQQRRFLEDAKRKGDFI